MMFASFGIGSATLEKVAEKPVPDICTRQETIDQIATVFARHFDGIVSISVDGKMAFGPTPGDHECNARVTLNRFGLGDIQFNNFHYRAKVEFGDPPTISVTPMPDMDWYDYRYRNI